MTTNAFIARGGQQFSLSSMFAPKSGAGSPTYLVLTGLDRNEYTAGATGATGSLIGNGMVDNFSAIGGDGRGVGAVFTLQASSGRYFSSTYGYFDQMRYQASSSLNDVTSLSLFGTNDQGLASHYANNAYAMEQLDGGGYLGSATIATQPGFTAPVPAQATPASIAAAALSFVGQAWNMNGCWVLASTIAAEAGAALPVDSSMLGVRGQANGEWMVAFDGSRQSGNWQSLVKAGEIVVIGSGSSGHITTCVSGAGGTAMLVDNITYVNAAGAVQNGAHDGSASDVLIAAPHLASQEWNGVLTSMVKIYQLDTPQVSNLVAVDTVALHARQALAPLFAASDPAGKAITQYQLYDTASGDSFVVGGTTVTAHSAASAVTVGSLAAVSLLVGSAAADTISIRAYNGSYWGDWDSLGVTVGASSATGVVAAAPAAPVVTQTAAQTWSVGQHVSFTLPVNAFVDPQGQKMSYSATLANGQPLPSWLTFQAATETFSGIVPAGTANFSLKVSARDASGLSAAETIAVTVAPGAPTLLHQTDNQAWLGGQKVTLTIPAGAFSDPQGQHLSYSAAQLNGPSVLSWLRFDPNTEAFSGIVPKGASGVIELDVMAKNSSGHSTDDLFYVSLGTSVTLVGHPSAVHGLELVHGLM